MTVYLLTFEIGDDSSYLGVFSSIEKAKQKAYESEGPLDESKWDHSSDPICYHFDTHTYLAIHEFELDNPM